MNSSDTIRRMVQAVGLDAREATAALRDATAGRLRAGFGRLIEAEPRAEDRDPRDATISVVPFIDCARRLGLDPATTLGPVAATGPRWFRDVFEALVRRPDLVLADFGWAVTETPEGPAYRFAWPEQGRPPSL